MKLDIEEFLKMTDTLRPPDEKKWEKGLKMWEYQEKQVKIQQEKSGKNWMTEDIEPF